jgi:uncharacterized protein with GYD domain
MAKFLVHATYTPEGVQGLIKDGASGRKDAIKALLKSAGGKLDAIYFGIGADEALVIADLPDNAAAARVSAAVSAAGLASLVTTTLLTVEELDKALSKGAKYRAPGQD